MHEPHLYNRRHHYILLIQQVSYFNIILTYLSIKTKSKYLAGPTNTGYIPNVASPFQAQVVAGTSGGNTFGIPTAFGSQNAPPPNMQNYTSQVISKIILHLQYFS